MNSPIQQAIEPLASQCPMHSQRKLNACDELIFPKHKRTSVQYLTNPEGNRELYLFYEDKEISFDEPELFGFGENLPKQAQFIAQDAVNWGTQLEWPRVRQLLEQLIAEGILYYADSYLSPASVQDGNRPSPLPAALTDTPRTWFEAESISHELTGRTLELGYLELVIPMFRIAHPMLDAESRQVGEANVFPKQLRLDIPTSWRTCIFPGSRYLDERPMNVTALKSMRTYWPQIMVALRQIREAYLQRYPAQRDDWTVEGLETLASLVLAVPTYQLLRNEQRVENGTLHPALSSMFRVSDGLRVVLRQMLFVPIGEATIRPTQSISSQEIYDYAERNFAFASEHGVCAGPKVMIEEFLDLLVNGVALKEFDTVTLDVPVQAALADLNSAFDYGLYGLKIHTVVSCYWPLLAKTYIQLANRIADWNGPKSDSLQQFEQRLQTAVATLTHKTLHATDEWRSNREQAYNDIYKYYAQGLGLSVEQQSLQDCLERVQSKQHQQAEQNLYKLLESQIGCNGACQKADIENLVTCLMEYCIATQTLIRLACELQANVNQLLGRSAPLRPFDAATIDILSLLQTSWLKRLPTIVEELEAVFGIRIVMTNQTIAVSAVDLPVTNLSS